MNQAVPPPQLAAATRLAAPAGRTPWLGIACGLTTSLIWGIQAVVSRQSVADGLTAADVTILRFATAALLLLPFALRRMRPFPIGRIGWRRALVLTALAGAPYSLVLIAGASFAPALHSATITPGLIPVFTAILAYILAGERPGRMRLAGLALVLAGVGAFSWQALSWQALSSQPLGHAPAHDSAWIGDLLFVLTAMMWTLFGLLAKRWGADAIDVTIATCLLSLLFLPVVALALPIRLGEVAWGALALQAFYQGALVGVGALFLYTRTVALLGAARATLFLPLNPAITALTGAVLLGEWPSRAEIIGMLLVITGMTVALRSRGTA
ncbi:drug/metabolite transporter (DMT)-like permease [Bosea sp. BE125]|uniref:DMT family transporter n=1 Tax=Bosea sp. BE125 TaxID=2817909 RepID=UPI0028627BDF|nr:DMT family transporter [Bosea sp. BE125]MDR6872709.1 drug/metabolite transporter (DMT)-like permease [Bosea sp. BE125]